MSKYYVCKEVGPNCPVSGTTLGYYPNVGSNIFFAVGFGIAAVTTLVIGIWKKTYSSRQVENLPDIRLHTLYL